MKARASGTVQWTWLGVLVAAVLVTAASHPGMNAESRVQQGEMFVPHPAEARVSSLGFQALMSDYYWLAAVQVVGRERAGIGEHAPLIARLIDVVTALDPWVDHPYRFAAVWLTESIESVLRANTLLERGIAHHPNEWRNRHYLGFNYFYYLSDNRRAAQILEQAARLPGAPAYLATLVAKLRTDREGLDTAAAFLNELADSSDDPYARAQHLKALDEVETERQARRLDRARALYRQRTGRDIERVEDLVSGPNPVLRRLPPAHPHFQGFEWTLTPETGEIHSSFYRGRFRTHVHRRYREQKERWRQELEAEAEGSDASI